MKQLKLFSDKEHYVPSYRNYLNNITKAFWNEKCPEERKKHYGSRVTLFEEAHSLEDADLYVLTMKWNYYVDYYKVNLVRQAVIRARQACKKFVMFSEGDFTATLPFSGIILFEKSTYRSRCSQNGNCIFAEPAFIQDYLQLYCDGKLSLRRKSEKPIIGFCGQAGGNIIDFLKREAINQYRKMAYSFGKLKWEPTPFETTSFRSRILKSLASSRSLHTNFIIRKRYRAGYTIEQKDPFHHSRLEFIQNILDSDYTLCIRGGGNFSVRFYETLSLGRIPVFVDTDCVLPFDEAIDYRKYCIWIEKDEIPYIREKITDFHSSISKSEFEDMQIACRKLWLERLSIDGFYRYFYKHFFTTV